MLPADARQRSLLLYLLLTCVTLILYRPAFDLFFSLDDNLFLARVVGVDPWPEHFHRPLSMRGFFVLGWRLFGERAELYHLVILLLHGLNGWLLFRLGRRLGLAETGAALAAGLFVVSPLAFTCLHWISGVQDVMMTSFALLALLAWLRGGWLGGGLALLAYLGLLWSKEAGALLLPAAALLLPGSRRYRLSTALAALALAAVVLHFGGSFERRPYGHPYETAYGRNILWNLATYSAWLAKLWDPFPDRVPQFQPGLLRLGLALPVLLGALAAWRRAWRPAILKAALGFLLLLLPVLPLVRHSYLYYLYLPSIALWLLAGAGLQRLPARLLRWSPAAVLLLLALTAWRAEARREMRLNPRVRTDSVIRFAYLTEEVVDNLRAQDPPVGGDMLVLYPFMGESTDLAKGLRRERGMKRHQFLLADKATYGGRILRIYLPQVDSVRFRRDLDELEPGEDWERSRIYLISGLAEFHLLGEGLEGRRQLGRIFYQQKDYARARREVDLLLSRRPDEPDAHYDVGAVALAQGDAAAVGRAYESLQALAAAETRPGDADAAFRAYVGVLQRAGVRLGGEPVPDPPARD